MSTHESSALVQAVELATPVLVGGNLARVNELPAVEARLARGEHLKKSLLGIEEPMKEALEKELASRERFREEQTAIRECFERLREIEPEAATKYRLLSFEPLTWRDQNGYPRLAVFNLKSPDFQISAVYYPLRNQGSTGIYPDFPKRIKECYDDVRKLVFGMVEKSTPWNEVKTIKLSARFHGFVPDAVKEEILKVQPVFGNNIFVIAEPKDGFKLETVVVPDRDPLVVGLYGSTLWLIATFDTTTLEEAMASGLVTRN